jgi:hypothetical protein
MTQTSGSIARPKRIPLNIVDAMFNVPEHDSIYFPMSLVLYCELQSPVEISRIQQVLNQLDSTTPQFRLAYELDPVGYQWVRVDDDRITAYLNNMVVRSDASDVEVWLSNLINRNNEPISQPLQVFADGSKLAFRINHTFADENTAVLLVYNILCLLCDRPDSMTKPEPHFDLPIRTVVFSNTRSVLKATFATRRNIQAELPDYNRQIARTGSPMCVELKEISAAGMKSLASRKDALQTDTHIRLTTYLQVLTARALEEMGRLGLQHVYSYSVDYRRYLSTKYAYVPGNFIGQIKAVGDGKLSFADECAAVQQDLDQQIESRLPLADIMPLWLLRHLGGKKMFGETNRKYLVDEAPDNRFFVFTGYKSDNLNWNALADMIKTGVYTCVPLMSQPPLVVSLHSANEKGFLAVTYNPEILTKQEIAQILRLLSD